MARLREQLTEEGFCEPAPLLEVAWWGIEFEISEPIDPLTQEAYMKIVQAEERRLLNRLKALDELAADAQQCGLYDVYQMMDRVERPRWAARRLGFGQDQ